VLRLVSIARLTDLSSGNLLASDSCLCCAVKRADHSPEDLFLVRDDHRFLGMIRTAISLVESVQKQSATLDIVLVSGRPIAPLRLRVLHPSLHEGEPATNA